VGRPPEGGLLLFDYEHASSERPQVADLVEVPDPVAPSVPETGLARILSSIASNWTGTSDGGDRLAAQMQALGLAYLAECRPGGSGTPADDHLTSAVLEEFVVSAYPVPSLQLLTPLGFSFTFDRARVTDLITRAARTHGVPAVEPSTWVHDLAEAISAWRPGVCSAGPADSHQTFLRKKALSAILGFAGGAEEAFPGTVVRYGSPRPGRLPLDVLVLGGCDLSRIVNVAQHVLLRSEIESTWWEDVLRAPAGFLPLRLAGEDGCADEVREGLSRHLGAIFLHNIRQVGAGWPWPRALSACVLSVDGDLHKSLHRHRATGALVHFPRHWGGALSNFVDDLHALKRWIDAEWEPLPLATVDEIIDSLERFCVSFRRMHPDIRIYVVNANQVRPRHAEYDPRLHADPAETRARTFNAALRQYSAVSGIRILDFSLYARRGGLDGSKDIRHVRNDVYDRLGTALAEDLAGHVSGDRRS
jgi:hypothetical protein